MVSKEEETLKTYFKNFGDKSLKSNADIRH